jgi:hypothetical protein
MRRLAKAYLFAHAVYFLASPAWADEADVVSATIAKDGANTYSIAVGVRHKDTGWDNYADRWEVLGHNGEVLATRKLLHPHVGEQPFVRSLSGIQLPTGFETLTVRAHDKVHGFGGKVLNIKVPVD